MEKEIELSIIVPIYNVEMYLNECLESIYKINNISKEIILVNDKSSDKSYQIIEKYKREYPIETVIVNHNINQGLSQARNSGLRIAKGKYISFVDSDDLILSKKYETIFNENKEKNLDIILANGREYKDKKIGEKFKRSMEIKELKITSGKLYLKKMLESNSYYEMVWLNIYKRDFLIENNIEFYKGLLHEDALFTFLVLMKAKNVKYVDIDFYLYRQRDNSIMSNITLKNEKHRLFICDRLVSLVKKKKENDQILNKYIFNLYWGVFRRSKIQNNKLLLKIFFLKTKSLKIFVKKIILLLNLIFNKKRIDLLI